eukprot:705821-Prorocentrum_minimum.AAC.1
MDGSTPPSSAHRFAVAAARDFHAGVPRRRRRRRAEQAEQAGGLRRLSGGVGEEPSGLDRLEICPGFGHVAHEDVHLRPRHVAVRRVGADAHRLRGSASFAQQVLRCLVYQHRLLLQHFFFVS